MLKSLAKSMLPGTLQGAIRAYRLKKTLSGYAPHVVKRTYAGKQFSIYLSDPVAEQWYDHDWEQLPEIAVMIGRSLRPGARVFDFGAHQGVVAMMIAEQVQPGGQVVAVEANQHNCRAARRNAELNGYGRLEVLYEAVSSEPGVIRFNEALNGQVDKGAGSHGVVEVKATTIDAMAERYGAPDAVFIDIEGFECRALGAATRTLQGATDFFVEVHGGCGLEDFGGSVEEVLSFFPPERFALHHQPEADAPFVPLDAGIDRRGQRWCLVALNRSIAAA